MSETEWIEHDGNGMPVSPDTTVQVRWRIVGKDTRPVTADYFLGCWDGNEIEAYRIVSTSKAIAAAEASS